jgi:Rrf2 family protein
MRLSKAARHALLAAAEMARSKDNGLVTVTRVAQRHEISEAALAKVFQRLVRSGLAVGVRGVHGGYRLTRPASNPVLDVLDFEPSAHPVGATSHLGARAPDHVGRLFDSVDEHLRSTFASLTLDVLARDEDSPSTPVRLRR